MQTKVIKIGNSRGIRIPKILLEETGLKNEVKIEVVNRELRISSVITDKRSARETMLLSEKALAADWDRPEEDMAWADLLSAKS